MQGHPDRYSVKNILEYYINGEVMLAGKDIFERGFKFAVSEARKNFDSTYSADWGAIMDRSGSDQGLRY